jgi:diaminopimelate epimerase
MHIDFKKYQGTGNDFVMVDNLDGRYDSLSIKDVQLICNRKFGVGADGLIRLNSKPGFDFEMDYFNSDGSKSFCGNGARCSVAFAATLGIDTTETTFLAIDGAHKAYKTDDVISLEMSNINEVERIGEDYRIYTGSPHYIRFSESLVIEDIVTFGKEIRYSSRFLSEGINVNLVEIEDVNRLKVHTYERVVEDEPLSCGTGVTACAIAYSLEKGLFGSQEVPITVKGGELKVSFDRVSEQEFTNVRLIGPGEFVFSGTFHV